MNVQKNEWPHLVYFILERIRGGRSGCSLPVIFPGQMLMEGLQTDVFDRLKSIRSEKILGNRCQCGCLPQLDEGLPADLPSRTLRR